MAVTARLTQQIVARVTPEMRAALLAVAEREEVSMGVIIRRAITRGLEVMEG